MHRDKTQHAARHQSRHTQKHQQDLVAQAVVVPAPHCVLDLVRRGDLAERVAVGPDRLVLVPRLLELLRAVPEVHLVQQLDGAAVVQAVEKGPRRDHGGRRGVVQHGRAAVEGVDAALAAQVAPVVVAAAVDKVATVVFASPAATVRALEGRSVRDGLLKIPFDREQLHTSLVVVT